MNETFLNILAVVVGFPLALTIVLLAIVAFSSLGDFLFGGSNNQP
jgi:hypothetical protein